MKRRTSLILCFLAGGMFASLGWGAYLWWHQFQTTTAVLMSLEQQASSGNFMLEYLSHPTVDTTRRVEFAATNLIAGFPSAVNFLAGEYPYLPIHRYWDSKADYFNKVVQDWQQHPFSATNLDSQEHTR